ncbi:mitochondrial import inner membrane translocase subunit TIM8 [Nicotiana tabacum]|uniref:Mitochondrial import inner membrane translocase subunit n=1 Tax=Nicotiana tabacum TaxID=4097 RepID=A0A1S3X4K9_TOBAC|nr:mitochondrial import inner membrane translocase subunit TIM8-like [Nicotiana tomentosiformis]XP_016434643.1 PREDICTED: mitochondrial import inner membrane translocase subunit TIM8-like [Nicotiana tabacum]
MDPSALNSPELQQFLSQEKERAMLNEVVAKLTSSCWDKCVTGTPGSKFSSSESSCLSHCAQRYMEMSAIIMKRFQGMH